MEENIINAYFSAFHFIFYFVRCDWKIGKCRINANLVVTSVKHRIEEKKYQTRYSKEYEKKYSFIRKYSSNVVDIEYKFHCNSCNTDLAIVTETSCD